MFFFLSRLVSIEKFQCCAVLCSERCLVDPPSVSPRVTERHAHQRGDSWEGEEWGREDFRGWLRGIDEGEGGGEKGRKMAGGGEAGEAKREKGKARA